MYGHMKVNFYILFYRRFPIEYEGICNVLWYVYLTLKHVIYSKLNTTSCVLSDKGDCRYYQITRFLKMSISNRSVR